MKAMCGDEIAADILKSLEPIIPAHISLEEMIVNQVASKLSINLLLIITALRLPFARVQTRKTAYEFLVFNLNQIPI